MKIFHAGSYYKIHPKKGQTLIEVFINKGEFSDIALAAEYDEL